MQNSNESAENRTAENQNYSPHSTKDGENLNWDPSGRDYRSTTSYNITAWDEAATKRAAKRGTAHSKNEKHSQ